MRTLIISSKPSGGASDLARALGIRKLATKGREIRSNITLLNWGCGVDKFNERYSNRVLSTPMINRIGSVSTAANKLLTFQELAKYPDIPIPEFTTDEVVAMDWLLEGISVVSRCVLTGHSGAGIHINNPPTEEEERYNYARYDGVHLAPLYVQYKKKQHEYRVHVIRSGVNFDVDVQQKRKRRDTPNENVDYKVRNHANGWVYCRDDISPPEGIQELSMRVIQALVLDFGAVDIIWNEHYNQMYVLEVNTAPGLEGQTLDFYVDNLKRLL